MTITKEMVDWEKYLSVHTDIEVQPPLDVWGAVCESLDDEYSINEEFALYLTDDAKKAVIREYAPAKCYLHEISYDDNLEQNEEWIEESIQSNSLQLLSERIDDFFDYPEGYELNDIEQLMTKDGLQELFDELCDEFREWLWEHDGSSDPVEKLLNNTRLTVFYSLGEEIEGWTEPAFLCESHRTSEVSDEVAKIKSVLNLPDNHPSLEDIEIMTENASYGGDLRIYFSPNILDLISDHKYDSESEDFKSIHIKGDVCICVANPWNGSGDYCEVKDVDVILPFDRDNLHISRIEKYSVEEVFGMYDSWTDEYDVPTFSMEPAPGNKQMAKSSVNAQLAQERKYNEVFRAGGCTYGDKDIKRHRDVYYRNQIPCGSVCPHCNTFWID